MALAMIPGGGAPEADALTTGFTWAPAFGGGLIAVIALGVLAAALLAWRRRGGAGPLALRVVVIAALAVILLGPTLLLPAGDTVTRPAVVLMVDWSQSMAVEDEQMRGASCSRLAAVRRGWLDPNVIERLDAHADVQLIAFADRTTPISPVEVLALRPDGERTRLVRAAETVLSAAAAGTGQVTDVVLLTDGVDTEGDPVTALADRAIAAGVRLHAVVPGSDDRPPDVALNATAESAFVYDGQPTALTLRLRQSGYDGIPLVVTVRERRADGTLGDAVFAERIVADALHEIRVPISPRRDPSQDTNVSLVEYVAMVDPVPGETDEANNERSVFLQVTGERIKVCIFEGQPYWETRFLIAALRDDPQIEVTAVQSLVAMGGRRPPRPQVVRYVPDAVSSTEQMGLAAPLDAEALAAFDVIILGRGVDAFFPGNRAQLLLDFITKRGGAIVFLRGDPIAGDGVEADTARRLLDGISPVEWGDRLLAGGRLGLTQEGRIQPALDFDELAGSPDIVLSELPAMIATTAVERERSLSVVWMRQLGPDGGVDPETAPAAIAHTQVGRGRTLAVLTDGLWRWAFLPPGLEEYSSLHQLFWSRAIRWLALGGDFLPGQSIALSVDTMSAHPGQTVGITVRTKLVDQRSFDPTLTVRTPDGRTQRLGLAADDGDPSRFRAALATMQEGVYEVELHAPGMVPERLRTRFAVYDDRVELADTTARPDALGAVCDLAGGSLMPLDGVEGLVDLMAREAAARRSVRAPEPAWDRWWVFGGILALLGVEWLWRRRAGLP